MRLQFMRRWRWFCRDGAGDAGINRLDAPKGGASSRVSVNLIMWTGGE